jgi:hypothetical protein
VSTWNETDAYFTAAEEVLAVKPKAAPELSSGEQTDEKDTIISTSKFSMGEVWLAELTYRSAVARQAADWVEQKETLHALFETIKNGERERRLKLRKNLQHNILEKQAAAFKRVQQYHAEALESWVTAVDNDNGDDHTADKVEGASTENTMNKDGKSKKKKNHHHKQVAGKPVLSTKERIQHIADFAGATAVWDEPSDEKQSGGEATQGAMHDDVCTTLSLDVESATFEENEMEAIGGSVDIAEVGGIDVDMYMDFSSDDDALPLLADAVDLTAKTITKASPSADVRTSSKSSSALKSDNRKRGAPRKSKTKSKKREEFVKKVNNVVVLDQSSLKHAYFMDQILYSGSLLESHYVEFKAVAGIEDDRLRSSSTAGESKNADEFEGAEVQSAMPRTVLVIVTFDQALHLFELPRSTTPTAGDPNTNRPTIMKREAIMPGTRPEDALDCLLRERAVADLEKQQQAQAVANEKESPTKLRFRRNRQVEEETKGFQLNNLCPSLSMPLSECTVRLNKRGDYAVKITSKTRNPRLYSSKLSFASFDDQQGFIEASQSTIA